MMKFKLLRGRHEQGEMVDGVKQTVRYDARDPKRNIVASEIDLETRFGSEKFQNVDRLGQGVGEDALREKLAEKDKEIARLQAQLAEKNGSDVVPNGDPMGLKSMTVADLKKLADDYNVDLDPGLKKEEIINVLSEALDTA